MREPHEVRPWVVFRMTVHGRPVGGNAVCEQTEWDAMELAEPGYHTLIRAGITSEAEAEQIARDAPGGTAPKAVRLKAR